MDTITRVSGHAQAGDTVEYEDRANPPRQFVVVSGPGEWGQYELILLDEPGDTPHSSDLRQHGWTFVHRPGDNV